MGYGYLEDPSQAKRGHTRVRHSMRGSAWTTSISAWLQPAGMTLPVTPVIYVDTRIRLTSLHLHSSVLKPLQASDTIFTYNPR
jgi:hypothetical protein